MFDPAGDPVRPELLDAIERCWLELSKPGTWWDGAAKVDIARVARDAGSGLESAGDVAALAPAAVEATVRIAATPGETNEAWVRGVCERLGETHYVELVGVVARVVAVDTFSRLLGREVMPLPDPQPGDATHEPPPDGLRRNHTWISMFMPVPPFVLGAVPSAMSAMNDLTDKLYMPMGEMGDPDWRRGDLHRTQVELVAGTVSHENECFY